MADTSKIIFSNFHTRVLFDDDLLIADAFSMSENQNILESSCGYGGTIQGINIGVASPNIIGFGDVSATMSYNPTVNNINKLKSWIQDRNSSRVVICDNSEESQMAYGECYFTSISLNASSDSIVNADVDVWMYKNALTSGSIGGSVSRFARQELTEDDKRIIPFWATKISGFPLEVVNWSIDINQELTKKFYCEADISDSAPLPKDVFVGPMNIDLNVTAIIPNTRFEMTDLTGNLNLQIILSGITFLSIPTVKIVSASPDLTDKGGRFITLSYRAFKLNIYE